MRTAAAHRSTTGAAQSCWVPGAEAPRVRAHQEHALPRGTHPERGDCQPAETAIEAHQAGPHAQGVRPKHHGANDSVEHSARQRQHRMQDGTRQRKDDQQAHAHRHTVHKHHLSAAWESGHARAAAFAHVRQPEQFHAVLLSHVQPKCRACLPQTTGCSVQQQAQVQAGVQARCNPRQATPHCQRQRLCQCHPPRRPSLCESGHTERPGVSTPPCVT